MNIGLPVSTFVTQICVYIWKGPINVPLVCAWVSCIFCMYVRYTLIICLKLELHRDSIVAPWCSGYHYCATSFYKAWTQVLCRFKSCSRCVRDSWWWGSLTMVPAGNNAKRLSSVKHTTKTIYHHHHHHHQWWNHTFQEISHFVENTQKRPQCRFFRNFKKNMLLVWTGNRLDWKYLWHFDICQNDISGKINIY